MMKWQMLAAAATLFAAMGAAHAACPPLSVYRVAGVTITDGTLDQAAKILMADTAWRVDATPAASKLRVSLNDVGGPLDKVLAATLHEAGGTAGFAVASTQDTQQCVVHVNVTALAPPPSPMPPAKAGREVEHIVPVVTNPGHPATAFAVTETKSVPSAKGYIIPAGTMISEGLAKYVQRFGWSLRWLVGPDYRLDAPFPIPAGSMKAGVTYVVRAYQLQGGLLGDVPRFADPNRIVVIQPATAAKGAP
ncbi:hypothetical protein AB7849_15380 [Rhodanobacter sp. 115]|uniref:hypothetical protein n=1 Tax=Rhodanobacter sp. FW021-MT20 TaxID=1162282 RepID=UPI0034E37976